jgi:proline dehydrogenase
MRPTFFAHFCAGEDGESIKPTIRRLQDAGIGGILDYAAEADLESSAPPATATAAADAGAAATAATVADSVSARYSSAIDADCDRNLRLYIDCLAAVRGSALAAAAAGAAPLPASRGSENGFAAIKFTALADPILLERGTALINAFRATFPAPAFPAVRATDGVTPAGLDCMGFSTATALSVPEVEAFLARAFPGCPEQDRRAIAARLDTDGDGSVDAREWALGFTVPQIVALAAQAALDTPIGRLRAAAAAETAVAAGHASAPAAPAHEAKGATAAEDGHATRGWDAEDERRLARLSERLAALAPVAASHQVGLLIDAEQTYFQPLVDAYCIDLQRVYNRDAAVIWSTYQCYLVDAVARVRADLDAGRREGWVWAAKLVRGAYMDTERAYAARHGRPSPVWDNINETHASYARASDIVLDALVTSVNSAVGAYGPGAAAGEPRAALLIASHNQQSLERVAGRLEALTATAHDPAAHAAARDTAATAAAEVAAAGDDAEAGATLAPAEVAAIRGNVCFGQLLGMADHLTYTLARHGLRAFKYVPYGPVMEVMPYLVRRAKENSNMLGGVGAERKMLWRELKRRARVAIGLEKAPAALTTAAAAQQQQQPPAPPGQPLPDQHQQQQATAAAGLLPGAMPVVAAAAIALEHSNNI